MICLQFIVISERLFILLSHFSLFEYKSYSYVEWGVLHKKFSLVVFGFVLWGQ